MHDMQRFENVLPSHFFAEFSDFKIYNVKPKNFSMFVY